MYEKTWSLRRWWRLDVATPVRDRFWGDCRKREVKQKWYAVMRGLVMEVAVLTSYFAVVTCHTGLCSIYTCPGWQRITARTTNLRDMRRPINRISCSHVCVEYWVYGIASHCRFAVLIRTAELWPQIAQFTSQNSADMTKSFYKLFDKIHMQRVLCSWTLRILLVNTLNIGLYPWITGYGRRVKLGYGLSCSLGDECLTTWVYNCPLKLPCAVLSQDG